MFQKSRAILISLAITSSLGAAADVASPAGRLSASDVVDKNVAARGGLQAWRAVQTMSLAGKMGAGGNQREALAVKPPDGKTRNTVSTRPVEEVQLPFLMELKRPRKTRFELEFGGQTAVQVFDGRQGWKLKPFLNRREVEPYTADELKITSTQADLDGPLVDYAAKGTRVELAGEEKVEGRDTYKLKLTMNTGTAIHVWIDAATFLETKIEGQPRRMDGVDHPVEVYFRDYRRVDGLQIPFVLETRVLPVGKTALGFKDPQVPAEKVVIEKVVVNPKLDESLFSRTGIEVASSSR
jgi:outer membrane lipoprotein-sorting protein